MIDVIIPAYNAHKTIIKTLNSIINQKNVSELNVLIVDDKSDENYDKVCEFFKDYVNIRTIRLDENGGPGVARQKGLDCTNGEFIVFIDADDELYDEDSLSNLYNAIQENDISYGVMYYEAKDKIQYLDECLHGKMYRRDFLQKNNIRFNEYRSHEDTAFDQLCLSVCKKINYVDKKDIIYKYNYNKQSITNTIKKLENVHLLVKSMNWLFEDLEKRDELNNEHVGKTIVSAMHYFYFNYLDNPNELNSLFEELVFLKTMYDKYKRFISDEEELMSYKNYEINKVPSISVNEFINNIQCQ